MSTYVVSSSPHIRSTESVNRIMFDVVLALIPAGIAAVWFFGLSAMYIIALSIASAVITEAVIQKLTGQEITINDFSAVITGMLLAYNLPPTAPWWLPVIGSVVAISLVKHAFGGLGQNFMNPALAARAILLAAWPTRMTSWVAPGVDGVTTATPLALLKGTEVVDNQLPSIWNVFAGSIGGSIGEVSALALLLGAVYLLYRRVINWRIPVTFIATVLVFISLFGGQGLYNGIYHVFIGGLVLGAFYMATDYSSSPVTPKGQLIMGFGCGLITSIIRLYGGYPEGVTYSILMMNIITPLIDKYTMPKIYGEVSAK